MNKYKSNKMFRFLLLCLLLLSFFVLLTVSVFANGLMANETHGNRRDLLYCKPYFTAIPNLQKEVEAL